MMGCSNYIVCCKMLSKPPRGVIDTFIQKRMGYQMQTQKKRPMQ